jgi:hypothetical protein
MMPAAAGRQAQGCCRGWRERRLPSTPTCRPVGIQALSQEAPHCSARPRVVLQTILRISTGMNLSVRLLVTAHVTPP